MALFRCGGSNKSHVTVLAFAVWDFDSTSKHTKTYTVKKKGFLVGIKSVTYSAYISVNGVLAEAAGVGIISIENETYNTSINAEQKGRAYENQVIRIQEVNPGDVVEIGLTCSQSWDYGNVFAVIIEC